MNQEYSAKIAIVLGHPEIVSFFELEAISCGCDPQVLSEPPTDPSFYDLVLIDPRVGYCVSDSPSCRVIAVTDGDIKNSFSWADEAWEWPVPADTVRETYEHLKFSSEPSDQRSAPKTDPFRRDSVLYLISREENKILYCNRTISLTQCEGRVLYCLAESSGQTVSREELQKRLEGGQGNNVDVHVCNLRRKLDISFGNGIIETRRGKGYVLNARLEALP
ncbi:MAG: winged helix-turn-helix transcriptional regulator [Clostridia bacterium]|nr:winged helix-turn-helix transcriptional regulator [Clostridia bacterium]